ncbi:MAG: SPOR domain-containing protein [Methylovulum sp.]|nr:SPOR domain-containing protein [Methylovulum sp.]
MSQELIQRLIGAVVVTALAAIFIPMLFDDPVDNSGRVVSELAIPTPPAVVDPPYPPSSVEDVSPPPPINDRPSDLSPDEMAVEPGYSDEEDEFSPQDEVENIPDSNVHNEAAEEQEPVISEVNPVQKITKPTVKKPATAIKTAPATKPAASTTIKPSGLSKPKTGLVRWYVQAGSFSKKENATSLADNLRKQGLPVLLETIQVSGKGTFYRLRVGPELDKKRADAMKDKLSQQNIKSLLIAE